MSFNHRVIVISSVSGGGKTTVIRRLLAKHNRLKSAITATSRSPRHGEVDGIDYHFFTEAEFRQKIADGEFIEHAEVHGNLYGVPVSEIESAKNEEKILILNIDVQGMQSLKQKFDTLLLSIFLLPPDEQTWESRLRSRATDSEETIQLRLKQGRTELQLAHTFDYQVINSDLDECIRQIEQLLVKEGIE
ncbi:MAG: guanylate kinase [Leptonema sp. (in: Bacteria)]|nr:guanylate kinase [Leptonema sp. (in: bacteria)]